MSAPASIVPPLSIGTPRTVADHLVARLIQWGVPRIYGYPGDGYNGILGAIRRAGDRPRFVQVAHEELSAFMACAHAKFTGDVGVCMATSGPGAIHLLNGLYDARLDHQPVVAIVGQQSQFSIGGHYQQEVDLASLFKDVAGNYCQVVNHPAQLRHAVDTAFRVALARRAVTCLIVPHDVQSQDAVETPPHEHGALHSGAGFRRPHVVPEPQDLDRAAEVLNRGQRIAMLVGAGALQATDIVIAVAQRLGAGLCKALLGKSAVPDDLPFVTGSAGWLGTAASNRMLAECDTLFMVGSGFPYTEFLPREGQARGVQIDIDAQMLSLRYPMEVGLVGDTAATLRALLPRLHARANPTWRKQIERWKREWEAESQRQAAVETPRINPQRVMAALSPRLPHDVAIAADCGSSTVWFARNLQLRAGMHATLSGTLATMGSALPYAAAAKFANPARPVIAIVGDGAMQMNGINGLITVAKFWREWKDPRLVVLVFNNRDLNFVTWEQRVMEGEPKFPASQDLIDMPYARYAELLGLSGLRVERDADIAAALDQALAADRPCVLDIVCDPTVPPLPPKLKDEQKHKLAQALDAQDPEAEEVRHTLAEAGVLLEG